MANKTQKNICRSMQKTVIRTKGVSGPSGIDADVWIKIK